MTLFIHTQKQKQLLIKIILMISQNQSLLQLYQTQKSLEKGSGWITDSVNQYNIRIVLLLEYQNIIFQSITPQLVAVI